MKAAHAQKEKEDDGMFTCSICGNVYSTLSSLRAHKSRHSGIQVQPRILETNEGWPKGQKFCPLVAVHHHHRHHHQPGQPKKREYSTLW